jgi:universal stress protein E
MLEKILLVPESGAAREAAIKRLLMLADASTEAMLFQPVHEPNLDGYLGNTEIYAPLRKRLVAERLAELEKLAATVTARGVACRAEARWDRPVDSAVAREALAFGADLVIVTAGSDGRPGLSASDWRLATHCPAPVLFVKTDGGKQYRNVIAAVDPVHSHAKPAELDAAIVDCGKSVAERVGAALKLVHAFLPLSYFESEDFDRLPLAGAEEALELSRRQALDELATAAGLSRTATELVQGQAAAVLQAKADSGAADLIVMGGLARGLLAHLLLGSTAERLLHDAACDVLIVKRPGIEIDVSVSS